MWGQVLLAFARSFTNFANTARAVRMFGWSDATVNEPCSWTGIVCWPDGTFDVTLRFYGLQGAHAAMPGLAVLGLPMLMLE